MANVLTLIASPETADLTDQLVKRACDSLRQAGAIVQDIRWLAPKIAVDIPFNGIAPNIAQQQAGIALGNAPIDFFAQPVADRQKKLLVADMDSTIIQVECIDELADFAGLKEKVAKITEAAMRGELDFAEALQERVALLAGMDVSVLEKAFTERVVLMPGAIEMVKTMNKMGAKTVLVSGGFTFFTNRVARQTGFHINRANTLNIENDQLTGTVGHPIVDANTKLHSLEEFRQAQGLQINQTLAVGDGANDIPMIKAAGLGVAYHAKPAAAEAADAQINHGDLTALLYLQGYHQDDFAIA
ncbi:MAG: phosphoserine phosphatase SerB [Kordiimonas sp.]|nr:phosphoserine phosphatase SerB [Kordiimonas sp.]